MTLNNLINSCYNINAPRKHASTKVIDLTLVETATELELWIFQLKKAQRSLGDELDSIAQLDPLDKSPFLKETRDSGLDLDYHEPVKDKSLSNPSSLSFRAESLKANSIESPKTKSMESPKANSTDSLVKDESIVKTCEFIQEKGLKRNSSEKDIKADDYLDHHQYLFAKRVSCLNEMEQRVKYLQQQLDQLICRID